jgi:hypothetical protein
VKGVGGSPPDCDMCHEALLEDRDDPGQVSLYSGDPDVIQKHADLQGMSLGPWKRYEA